MVCLSLTGRCSDLGGLICSEEERRSVERGRRMILVTMELVMLVPYSEAATLTLVFQEATYDDES